jgi:hypothetical protein
MDAMLTSFKSNNRLLRYDFKFNQFTEGGIDRLINELIPSAPHVQDVELSVVLDEEQRAALTAALAANKPKKGKRKKK